LYFFWGEGGGREITSEEFPVIFKHLGKSKNKKIKKILEFLRKPVFDKIDFVFLEKL